MRSIYYPLEVPSYCEKTVARIIRGLFEIPRAGFKDRGVKNPESVGEHTDSVILLAEELYSSMKGLTTLVKIHDWAELLTGDRRTDHLASQENRITKERKKTLELNAMEMMCGELGSYGEEIFALWDEYETGETRRAQVAQQLDHAQAILKASEYEQAGQPVVASEFYDYYKDSITELTIIKKLSEAGFG